MKFSVDYARVCSYTYLLLTFSSAGHSVDVVTFKHQIEVYVLTGAKDYILYARVDFSTARLLFCGWLKVCPFIQSPVIEDIKWRHSRTNTFVQSTYNKSIFLLYITYLQSARVHTIYY